MPLAVAASEAEKETRKDQSFKAPSLVMPIPETTSAEGLEKYLNGRCKYSSQGEAWKGITASVLTLDMKSGGSSVPSINEPYLMWFISGELEIKEREDNHPWLTSRVGKKSFFLTTSGSPYECNWKCLSTEPPEYMLVIIDLALLLRAFEEVFGADAIFARLQDVSGFTDVALSSLMERIHGELVSRKASPLYVQGLAQAVAIHLARNYAILAKKTQKLSPSLPGYKLRRITEWMAEHLSEEFSLARLAAKAEVSKFHFLRLFKSATGMSPAQYQINLRMDIARQLLRETKKSVIEVAMDVGYTNPSHFARLFHRETGYSPSTYRQQR